MRFPKADWKTKDGAVQLYRGDAYDLLPRLPDASVDLVLMDPPYGHNNNNGDLIHRRKRGRSPTTGRKLTRW